MSQEHLESREDPTIAWRLQEVGLKDLDQTAPVHAGVRYMPTQGYGFQSLEIDREVHMCAVIIRTVDRQQPVREKK